MVGIALLLALLLEGGARAVAAVRNWRTGGDYRLDLDALRGTPWIGDYFDELFRSTRLEWHSYVYWRRRPFSGRYVNVDENGFRRTWRDPTPQAGARPTRIFAFGGSTLWGMGARDEFTVPSCLARQLSERVPGARVEVTNFAELGYVSTQEVISLEVALQRGNVPDLVIFYDGINDVFSSFQNGVAGSPQNETRLRASFEKPALSTLLKLAQGSAALAPLLRWAQDRAWHDAYERRTPDQRSALARDTVGVYKANLALVEALGRRYGFRTLFYWQPVVFSKRRPTGDERDTVAGLDLWREFFEATYAAVRSDEELVRTPGFHDIQDVFGDSAEPYYFDCCHTNERANEIVAWRMLSDVAPLVGVAP
jgi:lysophospholipase L1-like esterase